MSVRYNPGPPLAAGLQFVTVPFASAVPLASNTPLNVCQIPVKQGSYLVWGIVDFAMTGLTASDVRCGVNNVSATLPAQGGGGGVGSDGLGILPLTVTLLSNTLVLLAGPIQIIMPADGNIYMVAQSTFTLGNVKAFGTLGLLRTDNAVN